MNSMNQNEPDTVDPFLASPETIRSWDRKTLKPWCKQLGVKLVGTNAELAEKLIKALGKTRTARSIVEGNKENATAEHPGQVLSNLLHAPPSLQQFLHIRQHFEEMSHDKHFVTENTRNGSVQQLGDQLDQLSIDAGETLGQTPLKSRSASTLPDDIQKVLSDAREVRVSASRILESATTMTPSRYKYVDRSFVLSKEFQLIQDKFEGISSSLDGLSLETYRWNGGAIQMQVDRLFQCAFGCKQPGSILKGGELRLHHGQLWISAFDNRRMWERCLLDHESEHCLEIEAPLPSLGRNEVCSSCVAKNRKLIANLKSLDANPMAVPVHQHPVVDPVRQQPVVAPVHQRPVVAPVQQLVASQSAALAPPTLPVQSMPQRPPIPTAPSTQNIKSTPAPPASRLRRPSVGGLSSIPLPQSAAKPVTKVTLPASAAKPSDFRKSISSLPRKSMGSPGRSMMFSKSVNSSFDGGDLRKRLFQPNHGSSLR